MVNTKAAQAESTYNAEHVEEQAEPESVDGAGKLVADVLIHRVDDAQRQRACVGRVLQQPMNVVIELYERGSRASCSVATKTHLVDSYVDQIGRYGGHCTSDVLKQHLHPLKVVTHLQRFVLNLSWANQRGESLQALQIRLNIDVLNRVGELFVDFSVQLTHGLAHILTHTDQMRREEVSAEVVLTGAIVENSAHRRVHVQSAQQQIAGVRTKQLV